MNLTILRKYQTKVQPLLPLKNGQKIRLLEHSGSLIQLLCQKKRLKKKKNHYLFAFYNFFSKIVFLETRKLGKVPLSDLFILN